MKNVTPITRQLWLVVTIVITLFSVNLNAQPSEGGMPPSFEEGKSINAVGNYNIDEISIYPPNVDVLLREDKDSGKNGLPPRVGTNVSVDAGLNTAGSWTTRPDGSRVWILKITSKGAIALNFIFDDFYLAPGTKMFMYNENKKQVLGAFTHNNNKEHGRFTTTKIQGETVFIEYFEPAKTVGTSHFHIESAGYFYNMSKQLARMTETYGDENSTKTVGASDDCEVNINCSPVGDDWQDEKRGVAQITFLAGGSWYLCTGSLVNNTAYDGTPYFLTAFHCGAADATDTELQSWEFHFNYESPDCTDPTSEPNTDDIIGCTRVASGNINGGSDFFLVKLNSTPDGTFSPYYNGWDNSGNVSSTGVGIHHPSGDIKKISTYGYINGTGSVNIGGDIMAANAAWEVEWAANDNGWGVTEGGSSGSPLFRDNGLLIGTLTGGSSYCTNQTAHDFYGRFEYHWNSNGGTADVQLEPWLDPENTGATTLDGYDPFATAPPTINFTADRTNILEGDAINYTDLSLSPSGPITAWSWTFNGGNPSTSTNQNPTNITYNTAGQYDVSLAATNANGTSENTAYNYINVIDPTVTTCDTFSQWCCNPTIYTSAEGYVGGTNEYGIQEVAEYFPDVYPYNTVTGARFHFAQVTSGTNPDITFKVYSDNAGQPDQVLASTTVPLSTIETAYNTDGYYDLVLPESVAYPDDAFYIGFTVPGTQASGDTIAVLTNADGDSDANTGYSLDDGTWETYAAWGMSLQNMVFPNVCHDVSLPPIASFEGVPQMVNAGSSVAFTDLSYGGTPTSWEWTFPGAATTSSTQQNPNITYNTPGIYDVKLVVSNANGTDSLTRSGYITVVDPNTCTCNQLGHVVGSEVLYTVAAGEYLAGTNHYGDIAKAEYFDDYGTADNLEGAYFSFGAADVTNAGTNVTFNVWAADGGASVGGTYTYSPGTVIASTTVPITTIANDVANGDSTYVLFDPPIAITGNFFLGFEIPSPTTLDDAIGLMTGYQDAGTDRGWEQWSDNDWYSMTEAGWGGSFNMAIYPVVCTEGAPLPEFSADNTTIMTGGTVNFTDMSTCGPTSWDWTFEGGTPGTSTNRNPSVVYNNPGTYDVSLWVSNAQGSNPMQKSNYINVLQPIVWWDFPNNPDDALSDGGITANDGTKSISVVGGVNAPTFPLYAQATGWGSGANTKAWVVEFETTNYVNLKLSSKQSGANLSPQDFKIQYSLDNATWTDVTGGTITVAQDWTTGVVNNLSLPAACENQSSVYIRWIMTTNTGIGGNLQNFRSSYIDDIYVVGELSATPPVADFAADQTTICEGATVNFTDLSTQSPSSWSWTFDGGTPATSTAQNPSVVYSTAGTYDVSLTATNGSGSDDKTKTNYITVNALATVSAGANAAICEGDSYTMSGTMGGSATGITWTTSGTGTFDDATLLNAVYTPSSADITAGSVTLTITTTGPCAPVTDDMVLTINSLPVITSETSTDETACGACDGTITILATGTAPLTYSIDGGSNFLENGGIFTDLCNGNYPVVVKNGDACQTIGSTLVVTSVGVPQAPTAGTDTTYCFGDVLADMTASGTGGTLIWYSDPGLTDSIGTGGTYTPSNTIGTTVYYVTEKSGACESTSSSVTITINPSATASAGANAAICEGDSYTMSGTMGGSATGITWTTSGTGTFDDATLLNAVYIPSSADITTGSVTLTITTTGPCAPVTDDMVLTINPSATASAGADDIICEGDSYTMSGTMGGSATGITWTTSGTGTFDDVNLLTATYTPSAADITAGTVTLTITTSGPCAPVADNMVLTINPSATVSVSVSASSDIICYGTTVTFTAIPVNGGTTPTYEWFVNGVNVGAANSPVFTTSSLNDGDGVYCRMTSSETCITNSQAQSNTVTMTVNSELPVSVALSADNNSICDGEDVTFTANPANGGASPSYDWLVNGTSVGAPDANTFSTSALNDGDIVEVVLTSSESCATNNPATSNAVNMIVNPLPVLNLPDTVLIACINEPFEYTLETTYDEVIWPDGEADQTYSYTYTDIMTDTLIVTVGNSGCYVSDTLIVDAQVCSKITETEDMHLSLYPNPTTGNLNINISEYHGKLVLQILSIEGRQILDKDFYSDGQFKYNFDMTPYVSGMYIVKVQTENDIYHYRVVKQ